jgi:hypothetical protein
MFEVKRVISLARKVNEWYKVIPKTNYLIKLRPSEWTCKERRFYRNAKKSNWVNKISK